MKSLNWNNILSISLSFFIFRIIVNTFNYLFAGFISNNTILNVCLILISGFIIFLLCKYFLIEEIEVEKKLFLTIFLSLVISSILLMFFELFLHHYVDEDYKNRISDQQIERQVQKIKEIEEKKNVTMDFDSEEMKNRILEKYTYEGIISTLPFSIIFSFLCSLVLNIFLKMQTSISKEHKHRNIQN